MCLGQPYPDAPAARSRQGVGAVLYQLEQLTVGVAAPDSVFLMVPMLGNQVRLAVVGRQGLLRLIADVGADEFVWPSPIGLRWGLVVWSCEWHDNLLLRRNSLAHPAEPAPPLFPVSRFTFGHSLFLF